MNGLSFTILKLGEVENDEALNIAGLSLGTVDCPDRKAVWLRLPSIAILVRHPQAGYLLYDTGNYLGNTQGRLPQSLKEIGAYYIDRDDLVDRQLERAGLSVGEVDRIILSHGHFDHMGGLGFFSGTRAGRNVYISREEFETGLIETHQTPDGFGNAYFKGDFEFPEIVFHFAEEGELVPGVELIRLPGHTPGTLGMVLHCAENTYIFPSDAIYTARNYGPPARVPGLVADTRGFYQSVDKVRRLQERWNATIIYPHDLEQLQGLKTAPHFYT